MKKTRILLGLLVIVLFSSSCERRRLQRIFDNFIGTEITIPQGVRQVIMGGTPFDVYGGLAKLIVYTDSISCSPCRMTQMHVYNDILDLYKKIGGAFLPLFVFSPSHDATQKIEEVLQFYRFDLPVFIDENGLFHAANPKISADRRFHTFLLDKNGKVVLTGDPVRSTQLWELYKKTITHLIENGGILSESRDIDSLSVSFSGYLLP